MKRVRAFTIAALGAGAIAFQATAGFVYNQTAFEAKMVPSGNQYSWTIAYNGGLEALNFTGQPTGVGAFFTFNDNASHSVAFTLSDIGTVESVVVPSGTFIGYTTDQSPDVSYIMNLSFPLATLTDLHVGLDVLVAVPEPTTVIAGALLLVPFGLSTLRILRKNRTM